MRAFIRILASGLSVGLAGFLFGFIGPMLLAPGAVQGPWLAVYVTGPIGLALGLGIGIWHERYRE